MLWPKMKTTALSIISRNMMQSCLAAPAKAMYASILHLKKNGTYVLQEESKSLSTYRV